MAARGLRHLVVPVEQEAGLRKSMTSNAAMGMIRVLQNRTLEEAALDIRLSDSGMAWQWETTSRPTKETATETASQWEGLQAAPEWRSAHLCHCLGCAACRPGCPERGSQGRPCDFPLGRPCLQYRQRLKDVPVGFCRRCDAASRWPAMGRRPGATLGGGSRSSSFPNLSGPARSEGHGSPSPGRPAAQIRRRAGQQWMQAEPQGEACQRELFVQRQHRFLVRRCGGGGGEGSPGLFVRRCGEPLGRGGLAEGRLAPGELAEGWGALEFRCATLRGCGFPAARGGEERAEGAEATIWDFGAQLGIEAPPVPPPPPSAPGAAGHRPGSAETGAARAPDRRHAPLVEATCGREAATFELGGPGELTEAEWQEGRDHFVFVGTLFDHVVVDTGAAHVPGLWYYHIGCPRDRGGRRLSAWRVRVCDGMPFDIMIVALEKEWRHVAKFQLRAELSGGIREATRWAIDRRVS